MTQRSPFFSILIPSYNQAQYLGAALDSLLNQTFTDWEAIIVNDGSMDETRQVIDEYCLKDKRFRAFHKSNGGTASALNAGVGLALGKWICWLSSDDLFESYKLQTHVDWIEKNPNCSFFFTHFRELEEITGKLVDPELWLPLPQTRFQIIQMLRGNYIAGNSVCIHRIAWGKVGLFDETLRYGQDYDMWLRLLAVYPATYIPVRTCVTRIHPQQEGQQFPQAMFYDSAKAAIRFLNCHSLVEIFPLMDFNDPKSAWEAIDQALKVAEDKKDFIYALGSHPVLVLRIIEWASSNNSIIGKEVLEHIRYLALKLKYLNQYKEFSYLWKVASALAALNLPLNISEIEPADIAEATFMRINAFRSQSPNRAALKQWLERFEARQLSQATIKARHSSKNILLIGRVGYQNSKAEEDDVTYKYLELAIRLQRLGNNILVVDFSRQQMVDLVYKSGILIIRVGNYPELHNLISKLGCFDITVILNEVLKSNHNPLWKTVISISDITMQADDLELNILDKKTSNMGVITSLFYQIFHDSKEVIKILFHPSIDMFFLLKLGYEIVKHQVATFYRCLHRIFN